MDCANNKFCRSLNEKDRAVLCAACSLRSFKKGQVTYREDLESLTWIYVSGVMITQTDFENDMLEDGDSHADKYTLADKERFLKYLSGQLSKIDLPDKDEPFLRERMLTMYANPARNFLKIHQ